MISNRILRLAVLGAAAPVAVGLSGCSPNDSSEGTVVGNPGDAMARVATSSEITWTTVSAEGLDATLFACEDGALEDQEEEEEVEVEEGIDLLDPVAFEVPGGAWCELELELEGVVLEGTLASEDLLIGELEGLSVLMEATSDTSGFVVDGDQYVWELAWPEWLGGVSLPEAVDGEVDLNEDEDAIEEVESRLADGSAMFDDEDTDGTISDTERNEGAQAAGSDRPADADDVDVDADEDSGTGDTASDDNDGSASGCGNQDETETAAAVPLALPLLALPLLGLRRRGSDQPVS